MYNNERIRKGCSRLQITQGNERTTLVEQSAFEAINKAAKGQAEHDPLYTAIVEYSEVIQYEAFKEGVLTALSLLHPLPEQGDNDI